MINVNNPNPQIIAGLTTFTPTIPKFYWDVDSQEQGIKNLCICLEKTIAFLNQVADQVNIDTAAIKELQDQFKKFMESGFDDYYRDQIEKWFNDNAFNIYKLIAKQVFFGLTDDGYFCAYVPDSWKEITFDTGAVFGRSDYGRLCLKYDATGHGVVDNTYSYSLNNWQSVSSEVKKMLVQLAADLETNSKRTDSVFDTLYTNIEQELGRDGENE